MIHLTNNKAHILVDLPLVFDNPASCEVLVALHGLEVFNLLQCCKAGSL